LAITSEGVPNMLAQKNREGLFALSIQIR
jgi:hypothetical protein